jgi:hypothetical protein
MTWKNIHLDHIKPVNAFNLDDYNEFLDCCNYTKVQPLLEKDNLIKNNKWSEEDNNFWLENIKDRRIFNFIYSKVRLHK